MASSIIKKREEVCYSQNETINLDFGFGYLTSSGKVMCLFFPVGKIRPIYNTYSNTVSITSSTFKLSIRRGSSSTGGYLPSSNYDAKSEVSAAAWWGGYVQLNFTKSNNGNWGVKQNIPVAGMVSGTVKIG